MDEYGVCDPWSGDDCGGAGVVYLAPAWWWGADGTCDVKAGGCPARTPAMPTEPVSGVARLCDLYAGEMIGDAICVPVAHRRERDTLDVPLPTGAGLLAFAVLALMLMRATARDRRGKRP